jgi:hypothetical protein
MQGDIPSYDELSFADQISLDADREMFGDDADFGIEWGDK